MTAPALYIDFYCVPAPARVLNREETGVDPVVRELPFGDPLFVLGQAASDGVSKFKFRGVCLSGILKGLMRHWQKCRIRVSYLVFPAPSRVPASAPARRRVEDFVRFCHA
jgi:hypothetical protein